MSDLVSIVVPAYNAEQFLAETLESLLAQTYPSLEIIVVNDGSRDGTLEIARKFADRVEIVDQLNQGQARALNAGWARSRGRWIGYLSADDLLMPNAIAELVAILNLSEKTDVVYPDYDLIDIRSQKIRTQLAPEFSMQDLVLRGICQPGPGALFDRRLLAETGGWDSSLRQMPDFDFWLQCAASGAHFQRVPKCLAAFRIHEDSQTFMAPSESKAEEPAKVIAKFFSKNRILFSPAQQLEAQANAHLLSARLHGRAWRVVKSLRHLSIALSLAPALLWQVRTWRHLAGGFLGRLRYRSRSRV